MNTPTTPLTPASLLHHQDKGLPWAGRQSTHAGYDVATAYSDALAVRALRIARGERPLGYKVGFTNRGIWPIYQVYQPIWGCVWDRSVVFCEGEGELDLARTCEPRIEPEAVFGFRTPPAVGGSIAELFDTLDWVAPGFEIVQSHLAGWKFEAADAVANGSLHARLLVGRRVPVREIARDAIGLDAALAGAGVVLARDGAPLAQGRGANVLDGPVQALWHFVQALHACPCAPALQAGELVTTGTWTDAFPAAPGQTWHGAFDAPLSPLTLRLR